MATTVGQHSVAAFTSPVNGTTPIDANTVRGNDNTVRVAYVDHDADPGIHVQSSTIASRPAAGTAGRKWITEDSGVYTLWFDDGTNWHPVSSENINLTVLATETLVKGDVVKVTGWNNGQDLPEVAKVASTSDVAFAIITANVANGAMGYATNTGIVQDLATNSFSVGDILYPNSSGWFTATKPTSGNYQAAAYVLRSNANNGVLYVEFSAPRIVERSDNTASTVVLRDSNGDFSAGTINATAINTTTLDLTNLEVTNIKAKDGTASATIADGTGVMTIASSVLTTTDINGGTIDGTTIGGSSAAAGTFTTVAATTGNITTVNATTVDATNVEVTNIKAKDGTASIAIADSTGVATITAAPIVSALTASQAVFTNSSKALVSNAITGTGNVVMSASPTLTGTITAADLSMSGTLTLGSDVALSRGAANRLDLASGDSMNVVSGDYQIAGTSVLSSNTLGSGVTASSLTSVGTLTSLTVSGDLTVDTNTLYVKSSTNEVGIGTTSPLAQLHVVGNDTTDQVIIENTDAGTGTAPDLVLYRNSASPAASDNLGYLVFRGKDSAGNDQDYATVRGILTSPTSGAETGDLVFETAAAGATGIKMRLDSAGNLGLGVTPSAWASTRKAIQVSPRTAVAASTNSTYIGYNWFQGGTDQTYIATAAASLYEQAGGSHIWYNAPSGTAGNAISFTQAMTLDASGRLLVGTTSGVGSDFVSIRFNSSATASQGINFVDANASASSSVFQVWRKSDETYLGLIRRVGTDNAVLLSGNSYLALGSGDTERARIDASGNVGIGVTPTQLLDLKQGVMRMRTASTDFNSYRIAKFLDSNAATTVLQLTIPATTAFVVVKAFFANSRAPFNSIGTSVGGEYYYAIGRNGSGSDVVLDSNLGSKNWTGTSTTAGGGQNAVSAATTIARNGAEANTAPQVVNITFNPQTSGSSSGTVILAFEILAISDTEITIS